MPGFDTWTVQLKQLPGEPAAQEPFELVDCHFTQGGVMGVDISGGPVATTWFVPLENIAYLYRIEAAD